ncbi:hypothetical protein BV20DRAFT_983169 [Pilatotrama ljubarskyi]|nr:hypothetical protein BV20DRAFT_983169 [Pilatotrama ljubarskyi]
MSSGASSLSSPSLVSVTTTSSASSSTPLKASSSSAPKDYSAALGQLQSQYGWGGSGVQQPIHAVPRPKEETKKERGTKNQRRQQVKGPGSNVTKDFEGALGSLSSRFGFGGSWPAMKK